MESSDRSSCPGADRLSNLDDSLLHHILGFLDTTMAVRTCVLSKRWTHLWTCLPTLSFNASTFRKLSMCQKTDEQGFENFVTQVLIRRENCRLLNLNFSVYHHLKPRLVESLLYYALKNGVRDIYLKLSCLIFGDNDLELVGPFEWPWRFVNCQSLQKLELVGSVDCYIRLPKDLVLMSLQSLSMSKLRFSKDLFGGSFFPNCPNLEELQLSDILFDELKIVAPSLRVLKFSFLDRVPFADDKAVIVAPRLTTFKYVGFWPMDCSVDAPSLEDVEICLHPFAVGYRFVDDLTLNSIKMVNEFRFTKSMTMNVEAIQVLSADPDLLDVHLLKFDNLKRLNVKGSRKDSKTFVFPPCLTSYFMNGSTKVKFI